MTTAATGPNVKLPAVGAQRVIAGVLLALVGFGSIAFPWTFTLIVAVVAFGSLRELAALFDRKGQSLEVWVAAASIFAYLVLATTGLLHRYEGVLLATTVVAALAVGLVHARSGYIVRCALTLLGVLYVGKLLSYLIAIRALPQIGAAATVLAILIIAFTDIFAMLVGVRFGRRPLTRISPRKTVEGALGGLAAATAAGAGFGMLPPLGFPWWQGALIGAATSVAAQAGDLVESALKRDARVKDAGTAIAGHGGILDRFDSYFFGGVAYYGMLYVTGHILPALAP